MGARLIGPPGNSQQDRQILEPADQVAKPLQRCQVGPVRIIDRDHYGRAFREPGNQPVQGVLAAILIGAWIRLSVIEAEQPDHSLGGPRQQFGALCPACVNQQRLEQLARDA